MKYLITLLIVLFVATAHAQRNTGEVASKEKIIANLNRKADALAKRLNRAKTLGRASSSSIRKMETDLQNYETEIKQHEAELKQLQFTEPDPNKVKALQERLDKAIFLFVRNKTPGQKTPDAIRKMQYELWDYLDLNEGQIEHQARQPIDVWPNPPRVGDIGYPRDDRHGKITQIIDKSNALVTVYHGYEYMTIWMSGFDFSNKVDGQSIDLDPLGAMWISGPKSYPAATGGSKTVFFVEPVKKMPKGEWKPRQPKVIPEPRINFQHMPIIVGDTGYPGRGDRSQIIQVIDNTNALVKAIFFTDSGAGQEFTVWMSGFDFSKNVDGQRFNISKDIGVLMLIENTKTYETGGGGTKTVFLVTPAKKTP